MPTTPAEIAVTIAPTFAGTVVTCEVSEDMNDMWAVRARIKPNDRRRAMFEVSDAAETREAAIQKFIDGVGTWAIICKCTAK